MKLREIHMRDPFILRDDKSNKYYLYGTTPSYDGSGFFAYSSSDLKEWEGPFKVFTPGKELEEAKDFWAPEVHIYRGEYYMIATFKRKNMCRGCLALKSSSPLGPFFLHSEDLTPSNWEALDGTLYIEENVPYLIFVHEWLQIDDGTICIVKLSDDLSKMDGMPHMLFKASEASWSKNPNWYKRKIHVADGPFVVKNKNENLLLWSSFLEDEYDIGFSYPKKSMFDAPFIHSKSQLPIKDAGHGMVFKDFTGLDYLVLHENNSVKNGEFPKIIPIEISHNEITLKKV